MKTPESFKQSANQYIEGYEEDNDSIKDALDKSRNKCLELIMYYKDYKKGMYILYKELREQYECFKYLDGLNKKQPKMYKEMRRDFDCDYIKTGKIKNGPSKGINEMRDRCILEIENYKSLKDTYLSGLNDVNDMKEFLMQLDK